MTPEVSEELAREDNRFQNNLLPLLRDYLKQSSNEMASHYDKWDRLDQLYRGYRTVDRKDAKAIVNDQPPKFVLPLSYAQVQVALSYLFQLYTQRPQFFELRGIGPEDEQAALGMQTDLEYQLRRGQFPVQLVLFLLNNLKYGFGVFKSDWKQKHSEMRVRVPKPPSIMQQAMGLFGKTSAQEFDYVTQQVLMYEGCEVRTVSNYCFLPDPSVCLHKFQEGTFCAHEEETTLTWVKNCSLYVGTEFVQESPDIADINYRSRRITGRAKSTEISQLPNTETNSKRAWLTEVQFRMSPKELSEKCDFDLGDEEDSKIFVATMVNDDRIVRLEPHGYLHNEFNYSLSEYSPDVDNFANPGVLETVEPLQERIDWFINSRIANVKDILNGGKIFFDKKSISEAQLKAGKNFFGVDTPRQGLDGIVKQFAQADVTSGHVQDVQLLTRFLQLATGISDTAMGQFAQGRRSAREARGVQGATDTRLSMHGRLIWEQGLAPLARQLISTTRQMRSEEIYNQIQGEAVADRPFDLAIIANPNKIAGGYDLAPFDGTLPSERYQHANMLMDLVKSMAPNNPQLQTMQVGELLKHAFELLGVNYIRNFTQPEAPKAQIVPDEQAVKMMQQGEVEQAPVGIEDLVKAAGAGGQQQ